MTAAQATRNITIGRANTVHATADNDGVHATCGASMRRNGHRGGSTPTSRPVTCLACAKSADSQPGEGNMTTKPSAAQIKTLRAIIAAGGEMNGYAGQPGFHCNSVKPMAREGWVEMVEPCGKCAANDDWANDVCERPLGGRRGQRRCYNRVRITEAGSAAASTAANEPESSAALDIDEQRRRVEWSSPTAVWGDR